MDNSVSPGLDLNRVFVDMEESARGMRDVAEAAAAAVRPVGRLGKSLDSLGDRTTEFGSMPLPGKAVEPGSPGTLPDGTTLTCGPTAQEGSSPLSGANSTSTRGGRGCS